MNTFHSLLITYGKPQVLLELIAKDYPPHTIPHTYAQRREQ